MFGVGGCVRMSSEVTDLRVVFEDDDQEALVYSGQTTLVPYCKLCAHTLNTIFIVET